ncbi:MAG TPA: hypothetical protein VKV95_22795 [Terriglobia bacterium]|nr:hypothetical protein [Terriglobia bacterium]
MLDRKPLLLLVAIFMFVAWGAPPVNTFGQTRYTITDLGVIGGSNNSYGTSIATSINNQGEVVGFSEVPNELGWHAFLWRNGVMTDLGSLGFGQWVFINNSSDVVLDPLDADFDDAHVELLRHGQLTVLPGLGGSYTFGSAITVSGEIAGTANLANGLEYRGVIWKNGQISQLGPNAIGGSNSYALALNSAGVPVGVADVPTIDTFYGILDFHAVIWDHGTMRDIGLLGGLLSQATGINSRSQVVGFSDIDALDPDFGVPLLHAFLWQNGNLTDLGTVPPGSDIVSLANGINNKGQIVGNLGKIDFASCICFEDTGGFLWQNGVMTDLNTFLPPGNPSPSPFSLLDIATAINDGGQIVGSGKVANGTFHAFLLTPVPTGSTPSIPVAIPANADSTTTLPTTPQHSIRHVVTPTGVRIVIQ